MERTDLVPPAALLEAVCGLGYRGIELAPGDYFGADSHDVQATLERFGLVPAGAFVELRLSDEAAFQEDLAILDHTAGVLAAHPDRPPVLLADAGSPERGQAAGRPQELQRTALSADELRRATERAARAAERCLAAGAPAAFHPHAGSYFESPAEVHELLERTDPELLGICIDTGHCLIGGGDPIALAQACGGRLTHIHLKDVDRAVLERLRRGVVDIDTAWSEGLFCGFGAGEVDLAGFLRLPMMRAFRGWTVLEQDRVAVGRERVDEVRLAEERNLARVLEWLNVRT